MLLRQLATNLIDNAIRYNHGGGQVSINLAFASGTAGLTVANTGAQLSAEQVVQASEPFHRLGARQARGTGQSAGHGLGLPLVHSIAQAHHGRVRTTANPHGGMTVHVTLSTPAAPSGDVEGREPAVT